MGEKRSVSVTKGSSYREVAAGVWGLPEALRATDTQCIALSHPGGSILSLEGMTGFKGMELCAGRPYILGHSLSSMC